MTTATRWSMKGSIIGSCNCDWGCPCSFDARPTYGHCQGGYIWHIDQGSFGDVILDGLNLSLFAHAPGAVHEGHLTTQFIIDEKADDQQREALLTLLKGGEGGPFAIFASVTETLLEPIIAPFDVTIDGLDTQIKVPGVLELALSTVKNPVTGDPEDLQLVKPTGFTSKISYLGMSTIHRLTGGIQHDHSGQYAEYAPFEYSSP